ncbi:transferrin-binding protein-like solute binding protein [Actinobacillus suis]|uniref:Transferrin-binding protein B C-lobe/N-lobe beta-barrel domain-containing protein n=2 Tax=Actinobacillus suis TaxID=716 RepID=K0G6D7_ACTSU|nr:transferrin-binding protein-like solute binding protein [Actinobacillus suis]AFU19668.1 hypothetical protein ASU2_07650 [Actinobacillus suis H91-0380]AIJ31806.1 hypothetical protein ASU1_07725 [Actinobacillus suis ATCC 33415]MCO4166260.1 transferrin-binding protein-like solute binding protein [Actinobacillus suis]MCO4168893.1 transferrin-binding protein-like solute binding protein [Actinobacillus suis]MCQ9629225.1 transferrin-binding protein-like solute binding protein [Actinobacillus suis]
MKKHNIALTLLMVLGVAACGSSSGSSSSTTENKTTPTAVNLSTPAPAANTSRTPSASVTDEKPSTDSHSASDNVMAGSGFILPKPETGGNVQAVDLKGHSKGDFGWIQVEGKSIALIPNGLKTGHFESKAGNMIRNIDMQNYTAWGLVWDAGLEKQYLTTQGVNATTDIPKNGIYTYKGSAIQFSGTNNTIELNSATRISDAEFTADFDHKVFAGIIPQSDINNPIMLAAEITDNTFAGESNGIKTKGGFFGPQASEVIGDYISTGEKPVVGVFGAKKQDKR